MSNPITIQEALNRAREIMSRRNGDQTLDRATLECILRNYDHQVGTVETVIERLKGMTDPTRAKIRDLALDLEADRRPSFEKKLKYSEKQRVIWTPPPNLREVRISAEIQSFDHDAELYVIETANNSLRYAKEEELEPG